MPGFEVSGEDDGGVVGFAFASFCAGSSTLFSNPKRDEKLGDAGGGGGGEAETEPCSTGGLCGATGVGGGGALTPAVPD